MKRNSDISAISSITYDLVIVGGGITGDGILYEAGKRGYKCLLIEKNDFASGTSSKSAKLIHGGMRYLQHGQLGLVKEGLAERNRLLNEYPHLVKPIPFLFPIYSSKIKIQIGMILYRLLSWNDPLPKYKYLSTTETIEINDRPGMIGHINGKKSAHSWAWVHCNNFDGRDDVVFEGLSARIELGGKPTKPLSSFILIVGDRRYEFSTTKSLLSSPSEFGDGKWEFESKNADVSIKGTAIAPTEIALVEYTDTDDSNLWCYNSKMAKLTIELTHLKTGDKETFASTSAAAFELVNREAPTRPVDL